MQGLSKRTLRHTLIDPQGPLLRRETTAEVSHP